MVALDDRELTPRQIARDLPDVPLGTIYRHINILLEAGLVEIVGERRVKGTVERTFKVVSSAAYLTDVDREKLTADDVMGFVTTLTGAVQASFDRFTRRAPMPPAAGDVAFLVQSVYLTPEEYAEFRQQVIKLIGNAGRAEGAGYQRRMIAFFSVVDSAGADSTDSLDPPETMPKIPSRP